MAHHGLTRDRLVDVAHGFINDHGLDALTMRRLAAAAGVTPGALYKHVRDQRDLRRALADSILATIDLRDIAAANPGQAELIACFERMRDALLAFRDGARIVAGSYAPFAATVTFGTTVRTLLADIVRSDLDPGDIGYTLRNYTVGFVLEEQAYLALIASGEWAQLAAEPALQRTNPVRGSDAVTILTGDRNHRFRAGLEAVLRGAV